MDWKIRPYEAEDFETLYQIDQACYPPGIAYTRRMLRWFLALPGAECLVAEIEPEIAGFVLGEHDGPEGHLITLDVREQYRRRGLGSALLTMMEQGLVALDVRHVELETATDNFPAVAFWRKHGYRTRGVLKRYYLDRWDAYLMDKSLGR